MYILSVVETRGGGSGAIKLLVMILNYQMRNRMMNMDAGGVGGTVIWMKTKQQKKRTGVRLVHNKL